MTLDDFTSSAVCFAVTDAGSLPEDRRSSRAGGRSRQPQESKENTQFILGPRREDSLKRLSYCVF